MIPLPENPTVVIRCGFNGSILAVASNISPDLKVMVAYSEEDFDLAAANKSFVDPHALNVIPAPFASNTPACLTDSLGY